MSQLEYPGMNCGDRIRREKNNESAGVFWSILILIILFLEIVFL